MFLTAMSKKDDKPKIRRSWTINPKTQITPNKKSKAPLDPELCVVCGGSGIYRESECITCDGTGVE